MGSTTLRTLQQRSLTVVATNHETSSLRSNGLCNRLPISGVFPARTQLPAGRSLCIRNFRRRYQHIVRRIQCVIRHSSKELSIVLIRSHFNDRRLFKANFDTSGIQKNLESCVGWCVIIVPGFISVGVVRRGVFPHLGIQANSIAN
jgi:hypothetical protein